MAQRFWTIVRATITRPVTQVISAIAKPTQKPAVRVVGFGSGTPTKPLLKAGVVVRQAPITATARQRPAFRFSLLGASGTGRVTQKPAVRFSTVLTLVRPPVLAAARITTRVASATLRATVKSAPKFSVFGSGTPTKASTKPAPKVSTKNSGTAKKASTVPAVNLLQIKTDLVAHRGANAVVENAVNGRTDWVDDANATGKRNGTFATITADDLAERAGELEFAYADFVNKSMLNITKVELLFYVYQDGTSLNSGDMRLKYAIGGGAHTTLQTITGNEDHSVTPLTFDITADRAWTWADLDAIKTFVRWVHGADLVGANATGQVDAVELRVTATLTDLL